MGIGVYFDAVLERFNSILSNFDKWILNNFDIFISLADNGDEVVVYAFALIVIGFLMVSHARNSPQKNNLQNTELIPFQIVDLQFYLYLLTF